MDEHAAGFSEPEGASKKTAVARERKVAHFPRGLAASFGGNEFVVFPECTVDESEIAFVHEALAIFADSRKAEQGETDGPGEVSPSAQGGWSAPEPGKGCSLR